MVSPARLLTIALLSVGLGCGPEPRTAPVELVASPAPPADAATTGPCDTPLACARLVAGSIEEPRERAEVERQIGEAYAVSGAPKAALEVAERLREHPLARIELLAAIAGGLLVAGDNERMQQVLAIARSEADAFDSQPAAPTSAWRIRLGELLALRLATKHLELGQLDEAAALADQVEWRQSVGLLLAIAARRPDAQGQRSGLERAEAAALLDEPLLLVEVARGYLAAHRLEEGLVLLRRAFTEAQAQARSEFQPEADDGCEALGEVAAAHAEFELMAARRPGPRANPRGSGLSEAMRLARAIAEPECLGPLLVRLAEFGATRALERLIRARPDLQRNVQAHAALALAAHRAGERPREARSLATVIRALDREPELRFRVDAIEALARRYLDAGYVAEALALLDRAVSIARRVPADDRDTTLGQLAEANARAGRCAEGVALAREEADASYTLAQIAEQCTEPAELHVILDALPLVQWPDRRSQLLAALAGHFARIGALRRALELTVRIEDPADRARALVALHVASTESMDSELAPLLHATVAP